MGCPVEFVIEIECDKPIQDLLVGVNINSLSGVRVATLWSGFCQRGYDVLPGKHQFKCVVNRIDLVPGEYSIDATLGDRREGLDIIENALSMTVFGHLEDNFVRQPTIEHGFWLPKFSWRASV
jgi:hypothetical protein